MATPEGDAPWDATELARFIQNAMQAVRAAEVLTSAVATIGPVVAALARVVENDDELRPEVEAAIEPLRETIAALERAGKFAVARYDVSFARMKRHYGIA
jgi:hypothetical protein